METGILRATTIPYDKFKEKIRLTQKYEKDYKIEIIDGFLCMVRRLENGEKKKVSRLGII